jgi:hypothetical protein
MRSHLHSSLASERGLIDEWWCSCSIHVIFVIDGYDEDNMLIQTN